MSTAVEQLLDAEADKHAEIDELIDDRQEQFNDRVTELLMGADDRDYELFSARDIDPDLVFDDFFDVPVMFRDPDWNTRLSELWTACKLQAWLEIFGIDFLKKSEIAGRHIERIVQSISNSDLIKVAKAGIPKQKFKDAKNRRTAKLQG